MMFNKVSRVFSKQSRITAYVFQRRGFVTKTKEGPEPQYARVVSGFEKFHTKEKFICENGGHLPELNIAYETWGSLNPDKSNAILLHTGLSASSHAKSHHNNKEPGWWEKFIGPGLAIDTNKFYVICTNILGGCYGTTGPSSIDPTTGKRYAMSFPLITVFDAIRAQFLLLDSLGIKALHASVGSSLGGMQSLASAALFPDRVKRVISISAAARSHPLSIAVRYLQRKVLSSDPNWNHGNYYDGQFPYLGMKLAREIATISYRSGPEWETRFGRGRVEEESTPTITNPDFLIEQYLDYQGEKFSLQYDPNSLLYISKAMDLFDMGVKSDAEKSDLAKGLERIKSPTLVIGVKSDILFPVWQQREIANLLKQSGNKCVTYYELDALYGHDTFLIDIPNISMAVKGHLENSLTFMDTFV